MSQVASCPVCSQSLLPSFDKNGYQIGQCPNCGVLAVMDPVPPSELAAIYSDDYYTKDPTRYLKVTKKNQNTWLRRLQWIEKYQEKHEAEKKILDIGCGPGVFLTIAQEKGWAVRGVEISSAAATEANKKIGSNIVTTDLFSLDETESFDVVCMWAILEHLVDPISYLKKARSLLKPGGVLALATVNTDAWNKKIFASNWRYFSPPEHLVYFNTQNLKQTLTQTGFEEVATATRFSHGAFWQAVPIARLQGSLLPVRILRKILLFPVGFTANWFGAGDIIEMIARRI